MDKYIYLLLSLCVFITALFVFWRRTDLRSYLLKMFLIGSILGPVSELWYFQDYWRPPSLLGNASVSFEDVLFGSGVVALGATIYMVVLKKRNGKVTYPERKKIFIFFFLTGLLSMLFFTTYLQINSIFVSSFVTLILTCIMIILRKDLLSPSLLSGLFLFIYTIPIYIILFRLFSPEYWDRYWVLSGGTFDVRFVGIPLTEFLWYFSWGSFSGIAYQFLSGKEYTEL